MQYRVVCILYGVLVASQSYFCGQLVSMACVHTAVNNQAPAMGGTSTPSFEASTVGTEPIIIAPLLLFFDQDQAADCTLVEACSFNRTSDIDNLEVSSMGTPKYGTLVQLPGFNTHPTKPIDYYSGISKKVADYLYTPLAGLDKNVTDVFPCSVSDFRGGVTTFNITITVCKWLPLEGSACYLSAAAHLGTVSGPLHSL